MVKLFPSAVLALALFADCAGGIGCNKASPELTSPEAPPSAAAPAVAPVLYDVPGTWTTMPAARSGARKASYQVGKVGNDKEDAQVDVYFNGTGDRGDPAKNFQEWFSQFDGSVGGGAKREAFGTAHGLRVETVEVSGTYKVPLAPPVGPQKKAAVAMVKSNFRLYGAVVRTADRGNWFFKLTGPDETVQAARSALRTLLESAR